MRSSPEVPSNAHRSGQGPLLQVPTRRKGSRGHSCEIGGRVSHHADYSFVVGDKLKNLKVKTFDELYKALVKFMREGQCHNKLIWKALANPDPLIGESPPQSFVRGSSAEAHVMLLNVFGAWYHTPGALAFVDAICMKAYGTLRYTKDSSTLNITGTPELHRNSDMMDLMDAASPNMNYLQAKG